jgi:sarcosine oxidase
MGSWDAIVVGVGGMGSSACYSLAKRGKRVLGIEQFEMAHAKGSSHGETRLIRQAYFEHPDYVPLLKRSYELWDEISKVSGQNLFHRTGLVIYGSSQSVILDGIRRSAKLHKLDIQELTGEAAKKKFPVIPPPSGYTGIFESDAGYLEVENCVRAYCEEALNLGADMRFQESLLSWRALGNSLESGVEVKTTKGVYRAARLIFTSGPWTKNLLPNLPMKLSVHRVPVFWFQATDLFHEAAGFPCFAFDLPYGFIYGFPIITGNEMKIALHKPGEKVLNPSEVKREVTPEDSAILEKYIRENLSGVSPLATRSSVCLYTLSSDENFIVDLLPGVPQVSVACGFSGHGFKFASVIGQILADLAIEGETKAPISFLRIRKEKS